MSEDYSELEGLEVDYETGTRTIKGIVAGCEPGLGISIVGKDDPSLYLYCLVGPDSPQWKKMNNKQTKNFDKAFQRIVEAIKQGKIPNGLCDDIFKYKSSYLNVIMGSNNPTTDDCAFL